MIQPLLSFTHALTDPDLFGAYFEDSSWDAWKSVWKAIDGFPLTEHERELFAKLTGGIEPEQAKDIQQLFVCKGRGSGGSRMLAARGLFACFGFDWQPRLSPGETATSLILATDKRQAGETFGYVEGLTEVTPVIQQMVVRQTRSVIEFSNRTSIEVRTANFKKVRGYSLSFCGMDELAFWSDAQTGANPSQFVYQALLPALGRLPGSFLMGISTPWSSSGFFAEKIRKHFGKVA